MFLESAANQVRHLYEKGASVSPEPRFELAGEGIETVAIHVVVVANVKGSSRTGCPAKQKLPTRIGLERVVINSCTYEGKARKLDVARNE